MRRSFILSGVVTTFVMMGCKRWETFEVPAEVGRGLSEVDSLRALWSWLEGQSGYAADTLRMQVLYRLISLVGPENADSVEGLTKKLEALAHRSPYPAARQLSELAWAIVYIGKGLPDSALVVTRRALSALERSGYEKLRAHAIYLLGFTHENKGRLDSALTYYEQALAIRKSIDDQPGLAFSYNGIGNVYTALGQYAKAMEFYQKALEAWQATGNKSGVATAYTNIGILYHRQGQYEKALEFYQKALTIRESLGEKQKIANLHNNIGALYYAQGRYTEALEHHQKALAIREVIGHKRGLADSYNNIGNIYQAQGRYAEALKYRQKSLSIWEALGHKRGMALTYSNLGTVHRDLKQYEEALRYYGKALAIREALNDKSGLAILYNNIGVVYEVQRQYEKALEYYRKAVEIHEALGEAPGLSHSYTGIGAIYLAQGRPEIGRPYFLKALIAARQLGAYDRLREIYSFLAATDSALAASGQPGYWKSAFEYARLHHAYSDSVVNEEAIRKQTQLEKQYEYEKKIALLNAQQEQERLLAQAELRRQKTERNLSLIITGITILGTGVLLYFLRIIRRQKGALEVAKNHLEVANKELEQANAELKATNQALEESNRVIQAQAKALIQKNEDILDSIRYAERIQQAILPSAEKWRRLLPDSFLIYLPRDIVAGDFYWLEETERYVFLGVADATGHGVPGAFVSLVCANALNKAVREEGLESPASILSRTKALVSELLTREGGKLPDGMDIALVRFEKAHPWQLVYAGANRPLWIVSHEKELIELSPTRQPVGYTYDEKPFEEVAVDLVARRPVMVYGFTDGVVDQIGGPKGRKLMTKGLKELLLGMADLPCEVQRARIEAFFAEWKGEIRQLDDVTVVGVRVG